MPEFINLESDIKEAEKLLEGMDYKKKTFQRRILGECQQKQRIV